MWHKSSPKKFFAGHPFWKKLRFMPSRALAAKRADPKIDPAA
jgi:hypothetical protein